MFGIRNIQRVCVSASSVRVISKAKYSRRSDRNTSSYKLVKSNNDALNEVDNHIFGANSNWELLTPHGFRFYLPGGIGPGWLDSSTTAQVEVYSALVPNVNDRPGSEQKQNIVSRKETFSILHCTAQECPTLLRKDILELFPNCLEVASPQLTIITISQKSNKKKTKWNKENETERLAQHFVLAASDICKKLKMCGYWADFINPFSGQPYSNPHKSSTLYTTDQRFRCVGFTVDRQRNCKIISHVTDSKNFIGNLYTNATQVDFLKDIMSDIIDDSH
ncbi:methylmalonic aciduria and homocystinuria type D protein, mitochondrial [Copidosoma floridanum]|uniref:methylmalonic aciduria and homocystinuria type D protein, mitochondrial n=1 Tax=Copidosoma floridanum TaxID=29053 RepID=UPI0006C988FF|nr:methylmalonic aciduria and homocystinuria type D protein, mitochondrial [Copidosoma floridanum]